MTWDEPCGFWRRLLVLALVLTSCSVGPNYKRPSATAITPTDWRWKKAQPDDKAPKGPWWEVFHDAELDRLETMAVERNQNLRVAMTHVDEATATARITASQFFPQVMTTPSMTRQQITPNDPQFLLFTQLVPNKPGQPPLTIPALTYNSFSVPLDLSYEVDLWGRVRRSFEAAHALAQASVADYQNVLLTLNANVAATYFSLRAYDSDRQVLIANVQLRKKALDLNQRQFDAGATSELDLDQAKSQYASAEAGLADIERQRAETVNSLALLCGSGGNAFVVKDHPLDIQPPDIPAGLPSSLLERRPDIAQAERNMASKNAQIGVAYAAFFPAVSLTAQGGYLSAYGSDLFSWESHFWSFGPGVSLPIFNGGRNVAQVRKARADYNESVATYRQVVLSAFQDVDNALADIRFRRKQGMALEEAVTAAKRATNIALKNYEKGGFDYLTVVVTQQTQLEVESNATQVLGQRLVATVRLIEALGGSWGR